MTPGPSLVRIVMQACSDAHSRRSRCSRSGVTPGSRWRTRQSVAERGNSTHRLPPDALFRHLFNCASNLTLLVWFGIFVCPAAHRHGLGKFRVLAFSVNRPQSHKSDWHYRLWSTDSWNLNFTHPNIAKFRIVSDKLAFFSPLSFHVFFSAST